MTNKHGTRSQKKKQKQKQNKSETRPNEWKWVTNQTENSGSIQMDIRSVKDELKENPPHPATMSTVGRPGLRVGVWSAVTGHSARISQKPSTDGDMTWLS